MIKSLSGNSVSKVWLGDDGWVYKDQPKFLADNEFWCYEKMFASGYVPKAERMSLGLIRTRFIPKDTVINKDAFMKHMPLVLQALETAGIRHGDLTVYAVRVMDDTPYLIDFAESRLACDPRPDKRKEGDRYWLERTMKEICDG